MTIPRLDLAPKRRRAFSLWNPFDYFLLLYWVFFFPQAIRWYVNHFGEVKYVLSDRNYRRLLGVLQRDPVQLNLVIQGLLLTILTRVFAAFWRKRRNLQQKKFGELFQTFLGFNEYSDL